MNFMNRIRERNGGQEPMLEPVQLPDQRSQHPAVGKHIEYVTGLERKLQEALAMIETQALELDSLHRDLAVERRERRNAQAARDEFHTRAVASETAVNNAAAILVDEVRRGREFAAQQPGPPPVSTVPVDLDQLAGSINEGKE